MKLIRYAVMAFILCSALLAGEIVWKPEKTWVFAVGVLKFNNPKMSGWPDEGRVDAVMIDAYKKRGVPEDHIVFIKNETASKKNTEEKLTELLRKTGAGDTLVFYYAGHGGRNFNDASRACTFVTYDTQSKWLVTDVFDAIEKEFKGAHVLLTADCCHSGALAVEAAKRKGRIDYAVLTSAHASSRSTGNWTFTQCLVDVLSGNPAIDFNADGKITLGEAARYCEEEMAFCDGQLSCSAMTGAFTKDMALATAAGEKRARVGERCEGLDQGEWWKAKILDSKDGKFFVTWLGWSKKYDCWVEPERLRAYEPKVYAAGTACEVEWDKVWYKAKVTGTKLGLHFIHYEGYPDADDEWVPLQRIRVARPAK